MTPAQASGQPDFVTDWPVQGPTDPGMRAADCWFAQNVLPTPQQAACVDCKGPIPMWAKKSGVSFGGVGTPGFALSAIGDGQEIWTKLSADQQAWVAATLVKFNDLVVKSTGSSCPTWSPAIPAATGCFQSWFNANYKGAPVKPLNTVSMFDEDTLCALIMVTTQLHPTDFPTPFPDPNKQYCAQPLPVKKGLSTGAMVGIAAAGATALGGIVYLATSGKKKSRRR